MKDKLSQDAKNMMNSEFIMCVDNTEAEGDLKEHGLYRVKEVIVITNITPFANMVHVCFELIGKPGKQYHHSRFRIVTFSPN